MTQPPYGGPTTPPDGTHGPPPDGPHYPPSPDVRYLSADGTPYPPGGPAPAESAYPPDDPGAPAYVPYFPARPRRRSRRGLLIGAITAVVLLFCVGGAVSAWLLLPRLERGEGAAEPVAAVDAFLTAVYTDKDAGRAAELVCSEARDENEIAKKINEVKGYDEKYESPRFDWDDPRVDDENAERAIVSVRLTMTTADERTAEQDLRFTVVHKTGWWVCEVG